MNDILLKLEVGRLYRSRKMLAPYAPGAVVFVRKRAQTFSGGNDDWEPFEWEFGGVEMVLLPAGCFMMGSTDEQIDYAVNEFGRGRDWFTAEQPASQVCFDEPFWIDKYEVTNAQYEPTGCEDWSSEPDQPRNCVSWFDTRDFCAARDAHLPTEAEWEYAARGPDALVYPWGNEWNSQLAVWTDVERLQRSKSYMGWLIMAERSDSQRANDREGDDLAPVPVRE